MEKYKKIVKSVLGSENSYYTSSRSGVDQISLFGYLEEYDLKKEFPLLTTKEMKPEKITSELLWFLRGDTDLKYLHENNNHIWDKWADKDGSVGKSYGHQWVNWEKFVPSEENPDLYRKTHINQVKKIIEDIKKDPFSKRHLISAWNVSDLEDMALPPCHVSYQFKVRPEGKLDCMLYQRSGDVAIGIPFNQASAAILTSLIARETGLEPGKLVHSVGDMQVYCGKGARGEFYKKNLDKLKEKMNNAESKEDYLSIKDWILENAPQEEENSEKAREGKLDHIPGLLEQITREPFNSPTLKVDSDKDIFSLEPENIQIENYKSHGRIVFDPAI
jgi:thymidylate synthase